MANDDRQYLGKSIYTKLEDVLNPVKSSAKVSEDFSVLIKPNAKESKLLTTNKSKKNTKKGTDEKYVIKFKQAIKENSGNIPNYIECLEEIDKEFKINSNISLSNLQIQNFSSHGNIVTDDDSFTRLVKEKVEANKKRYGLINEINSKEDMKTNLSEIEKLLPKTEATKPLNKRAPNKRFKILKNCLNILKCNGLTIEIFIKKNPFQKRAYELSSKHTSLLIIMIDSIEFFEAVKLDKIDVIQSILHSNFNYLYSYDFLNQTAFHWAAKRGLKRMLQTLLSYGRCCNQYDLNQRTPLMLAAINNYYDCCQLLVNNGAISNLKDKEGKIAADLTTDKNVKIMLIASVDYHPITLLFNHKKA